MSEAKKTASAWEYEGGTNTCKHCGRIRLPDRVMASSDMCKVCAERNRLVLGAMLVRDEEAQQ